MTEQKYQIGILKSLKTATLIMQNLDANELETDVAGMLANVELDPKANIAFQVFDVLRELIVNVRLRPGQRLSELEIAGALKASKTPIREALIRLDEINLVRIVPQSGTYVTKISVDRFTTACFIRLNLEIGAVRAAAAYPDPDQSVEQLRDIVVQQAQAFQHGDCGLFFELETHFIAKFSFWLGI